MTQSLGFTEKGGSLKQESRSLKRRTFVVFNAFLILYAVLMGTMGWLADSGAEDWWQAAILTFCIPLISIVLSYNYFEVVVRVNMIVSLVLFTAYLLVNTRTEYLLFIYLIVLITQSVVYGMSINYRWMLAYGLFAGVALVVDGLVEQWLGIDGPPAELNSDSFLAIVAAFAAMLFGLVAMHQRLLWVTLRGYASELMDRHKKEDQLRTTKQEIVALNEKLSKRLKHVETSNNALGGFALRVGEEMVFPLQKIIATLDELEQQLPAEEHADTLQTMRRECRKLTAAVRQLEGDSPDASRPA